MILIIDNYDSFTYNIYQIIAQKVPNTKVVRNDKITISEIKKISPSTIILSPGPGRPEDAGECINIINHFSGQIPVLGICLGHQAIATAFGGKIIHSPSVMHGKTSMVSHKGSKLYKQMPTTFEAGRYHSLCVDKRTLPSCLHIEAETYDKAIMGLKHKSHETFGLQFHPESILTQDGRRLIHNFIAISGAKTC
jgi:anthranilate synthase/aminodeoxychorismate synthase-like glutamine amidotransferase